MTTGKPARLCRIIARSMPFWRAFRIRPRSSNMMWWMRSFSFVLASSDDNGTDSFSADDGAFNRDHRDVLRLVRRQIVQYLEADQLSVNVLDENDFFGRFFRRVLLLRVVEPK